MSIDSQSFGEVREFLHAREPGDEARQSLYELLEQVRRADPERYQSELVPYLKGFEETWFAEPLVWCTLDAWRAHGQGLKSPHAPVLKRYREVVPFGPYQLEVESLSGSLSRDFRWNYSLLEGQDALWSYRDHVVSLEELEDDESNPLSMMHCTGFKIDHLTMYDDSTSQEFYEGTMPADEVAQGLERLFDRLPNLTTFSFYMPIYSETYSFQDEYIRSSSTALYRKRRQSLFKEIKTRYKLRHLRMSHHLTVKNFHNFAKKNWLTLETLDLSGNALEQEKDSPIEKLFPAKMPHLKALSLNACYELTDESMARLVASGVQFPALESMDVRGTKVTEAGASLLKASDHFPALKDVSYSPPKGG